MRYVLVLLMLLIAAGGTMAQKTVAGKRQIVMLKADDLMFHDSVNVFFAEWDRYLDYIRSKKIKSSVGIIVNSLAKGNEKYADKVKKLVTEDDIELWNHGFTHQMNGTNEKGTFHEFFNTPVAFQIEQLRKSQQLVKEKLGITMHTFGAPGNQIDSGTVIAMETFPEIKVWLYGAKAFSKLVLKNNPGGTVEYPVHNPDFEKFREHYDPSQAYLVLQYHPLSWDEKRFAAFQQIIDFLLEKDVRFMTPYDYYQEVSKK